MNFGPRPQTVFNELTDRLEVLLNSESRPTEFEIRQLKREAEKLLHTENPGHGWVSLVGIAAIEWKEDEAIRIGEQAYREFYSDADTLGNLAVGYRHINRTDKAVTLSERAHVLDPLVPLHLEHYLNDLFNLGRLGDAAEVARAYVHRVGEAALQTGVIKLVWPFLTNTLPILKEAGISEAELQTELSEAMKLLSEEKIRYGEVTYTISDESVEEFSFCALITFVGTIDTELRLGANLAPRLAQLDHWNPCKLTVDFKHGQREDVSASA